jgi:hypothetical protein
VNILTQSALDMARGFVGVQEVGGNNRGTQVEKWLRRVGQPPGQSWCAALQWCIADDSFRLHSFPNPIKACASVVRLIASLPAACKLDAPAPGCWCAHEEQDASGKGTGRGHIGIDDELDPAGEGTYTIEGNTNSEGSRTGGGVWRHTPRVRPLAYWNLGFWDWSAAVPSCLPTIIDPDVIQ